MLEIKNSTKGWIIETNNVKVLTAIQRGLVDRLENTERLLKKGLVDDIEEAVAEIKELEELLSQLH